MALRSDLRRLVANGILSIKPLARSFQHIVLDESILSPLLDSQGLRYKLSANQALRESFLGVTLEPAILELLLRDGLVGGLAGNQSFIEFASRDSLLIRSFANQADFVEALSKAIDRPSTILSKDMILGSLLRDKSAESVILAIPDLIKRLLSNDQVRSVLLGEKDLLKSIVAEKRSVQAVLESQELLQQLLSDGRSVKAALHDINFLRVMLTEKRTLNALMDDQGIVRRVLVDGRTQSVLLHDEHLLDQLCMQARVRKRVFEDEHSIGLVSQMPQFLDKLFEDSRVLARFAQSHSRVTQTVLSEGVWKDVNVSRRLEAEIEFDHLFTTLRPLMDFEDAGRLTAEAPSSRAIARKEEVREYLLDEMCEKDTVRLRNARMRFPDRKALWTLLNEVFISEDYYFDTDSRAPRVIDGGAHMGFSTLYFKTLYPDARVIAFEPLPSNFTVARLNIDVNRLTDVTILPYALAAEEGDAELYIPGSDSLGASLTQRRADAGEITASYMVKCAKLSTYLAEKTDLLKLDIEGAEDVVLNEAADQLSNVHQIVIEFHDSKSLPRGRLERILDVLSKSGFSFHIAKSFNYHVATRHRPISHIGDLYSGMIWAVNVHWKSLAG